MGRGSTTSFRPRSRGALERQLAFPYSPHSQLLPLQPAVHCEANWSPARVANDQLSPIRVDIENENGPIFVADTV